MYDYNASERLNMALSPGLMATTVTQGQWRMARHLEMVDELIWKLVYREIPQRIAVVRMPPRHGKSELISHWTPTWFEAKWPDRNVLLNSYEATFAASWGRKARDSFNEVVQIAPEIFTARPDENRQAVDNWATTAGGYMATAGVGGPVTGKGFHLGIVDDLIKNAEQAQSETYREKTWEWLTSTFWSRREPEGVMLVVGTPWHRDDYLSRLRNWEEPICELCLPAVCESVDDPLGREIGEALWPDRYDVNELERIKLAQGVYYWNALYQQRPSQYEGAEWPDEYFQDIWFDEWPNDCHIRVLALDPSLGQTDKCDYSAFVFAALGHDGRYYIDADIARRDSQRQIDDGVRLIHKYKADAFGCETNQFQELLKGMFERALGGHRMGVWGLTNTMQKIVRIRLLTPLLASKRLRFKRGSAGTRILVEQMKDFPVGDYDDGPDALEMAIRLCEELLHGAGVEPQPEVLIA